ncbi:hypothetical protein ONQ97_25490, partial [Salmonella enterica subsp. enterica serovar Virginia]|nr:hypothetical protein [Salmonella enterica subsp. enterica serovar Virginia]
GASGVDMGRDIFQSEDPVAMIKAVHAVVHHNETAERAYELFLNVHLPHAEWRSASGCCVLVTHLLE